MVAMVASVVSASAVSARAASAQNCTNPVPSGSPVDLCIKASDLFAFIVPQVGVALAGGNTILGEGGTLGGWGKRSVTLRLSAVNGTLPANSVPLTITRSGATGDDFGAKRTAVPMPSLDAAVGLFSGIPLGLTNVGGVDALIGATAIPTVTSGRLSLKPQDKAFALSYGVRLGLLQESSLVPGIGLSYMRRRVPTLNVDYTPNNDTLQVQNMSLTANAIRAVISKRFLLFGIAAGVGRDEIEGVTGARAVVNETISCTAQRAVITLPTLSEKTTRNTAFVNASFGLSIARIVAEYGRSSAGSLRQTLNTFGGHQANDAYSYGSVGLTVRF